MEDINKPKFDYSEYMRNYSNTHYDKITIISPKGLKAVYKDTAKADGLSVSQYVMGAVRFYEEHRNNKDANVGEVKEHGGENSNI